MQPRGLSYLRGWNAQTPYREEVIASYSNQAEGLRATGRAQCFPGELFNQIQPTGWKEGCLLDKQLQKSPIGQQLQLLN